MKYFEFLAKIQFILVILTTTLTTQANVLLPMHDVTNADTKRSDLFSLGIQSEVTHGPVEGTDARVLQSTVFVGAEVDQSKILYLFFTGAVSSEIEEAPCSSIVDLGTQETGDCEIYSEPNLSRAFVVFLSPEFDLRNLDLQTQVVLQSGMFIDENGETIEGGSVELIHTPILVSLSSVLEGYGFLATFNIDVATEIESTFVCSELFSIFLNQNDTIKFLLEDNHICQYTIAENSIEVKFLYYVPRIPPQGDGQAIPTIEFLEVLTKPNLIGQVTGSLEVRFAFAPFSPNFSLELLSPQNLSPCNTEIAIRILERSEPRFNFNMRVERYNSGDTPLFPQFLDQVDVLILNVEDFLNPDDTGRVFNFDVDITIFDDVIEDEQLNYDWVTVTWDPFTPLAPFVIAQGAVITIPTELDVSFDARSWELSGDCVIRPEWVEEEPAFSFIWTIGEFEGISDDGRRLQESQFSDQYRLPARSLNPGFYGLRLEVIPNALIAESLGMGVLEIESELNVDSVSVAAIISGGSVITADVSSLITLDAFASCDPNVIANCDSSLGYLGELLPRELAELGFSDNAGFTWSCLDCSDEAAFPDTNSPLQFSILEVAGLFSSITVELTIFTDDRVFETSTTINLVDASDCTLPSVSISPFPQLVNAQDLVIYVESDASVVSWTSSPAIDFTDIDFTRSSLFIPKSRVVPGESYLFTLSATGLCSDGSEITSFWAVSMDVNRPPVGGFVSVTMSPSNSILRKYSIEASGWIDPELDLPISIAFESIELDVAAADEAFSILDTEFESTITQRITGFSLLSNITTYIPMPRSGSAMAVITVARDALGGTSSRLSMNAVQFHPTNTFIDTNGEVTVTLEDVTLAINELASSGQSELIPLACAAIGSNLDGFSNTVGDVGEIREFCMQAVLLELLRAKLRQPEFISVASQALEILSRIPDGLDIELIGSGISSTIDLLVQTSLTTKRGERDPAAGSILDNPIRENVLGTISNLVTLFPGDDVGRKLQLSSSSCKTFLETQHVIARISNLTSSVKPAGAPIYNVATENLEYATLRESANLLEQLSLDFLGVPNTVEFGSIENAVRGQLPPAADDLTIYAAQWAVDIQCNRNLNAAPDEICDADIDYSGPGVGQFSSISNTLSVELLPIDIDLHELEIQHVDRAVSLTLDLHDSHQVLYVNETCVGKTPCNIFLGRETVCGEFAANNREWSTDGCQPDFEAPSPVGTVRCICSHLSAFATWERFRADVSEFGEEVDETCEGWFSQRFSGYFFSLYSLVCVFLMGWAYYEDKHDEGTLVRGTVAKATLELLIRRKQKERFLQNLSARGISGVKRNSDTEVAPLAATQTNISISKFMNSFLLAVKYDHSLVSMPQFDPNYTKKERMAVFLTVVLANFAVSAFFYVLRETDESIEFWFVLVVSLLTAMCVSVPVKVLLKVLFRTTENRIGSDRDITNNCLKILNRTEHGDGNSLATDVALVNDYRELVWASALFNSNREIPSDVRNLSDSDMKIAVAVDEESEISDSPRQLQELKNARTQVIESTEAARVAWNSMSNMAVAVTVVDPENDTAIFTDESQNKGRLGQVNYYTLSWRRKICISDQNSVVMKLFASFADTPSKSPRARKAYLSSGFIFFDWFVAFFLIGLCLYISIDWITRRFHDVASNGSYTYLQTPEIEALEKEEIYQWLTSALLGVVISYGAAEPLALFFRHVLAPIMVLKFGNPEALAIDPEDIRQKHSLIGKASSRSESRSHQFLDLVGDIIENVI